MAQVFYTFSSIALKSHHSSLQSFASGCIRFILVFHQLAGTVKEVCLGTLAKKTLCQTETNSTMVSSSQ
jgi:hypothetical protein